MMFLRQAYGRVFSIAVLRRFSRWSMRERLEHHAIRPGNRGARESHGRRGPASHPKRFGDGTSEDPTLPNTHTVTSDCNRVMVHQAVIPFTAMTGPQPSARAAADPRTVRLALELLERTAGRRRRCRRCRNVIAENARKRGQAWSVCTACAQAIEDDARRSRSHRHCSGNAWCARQTSPTCEQAPEPALTPAETCFRGSCAASAARL